MWYNPLVTWLLRSPLRRLMDGSTLLLTYTGRKSGRAYTFPISYRQSGASLKLITRQNKTWWRSLDSGSTVGLWLRGQARTGWARVVPLDRAELLAALLEVYHGMPRSLAEQQVDTALLVTTTLEPLDDPQSTWAGAARPRRDHNPG